MNISADSATFRDLLTRARAGDPEPLGELLQWYSNYLSVLANTQLDRRLRRRVNPSDIVQEAMLAAHRDFPGFRGTSQGELLCWLRQILIHTLHASFSRHVKAEKRDIRKEISIDAISARLENSASRLPFVLARDTESPSAPLQAEENLVRLGEQLDQLKPHYRDIIVFRIIDGLSFDEIATRMGKSSGAVRMLWLRALEAYKSLGAGPCDLS